MLNYFIIAAVVATALVLLFGVLTMARGGEFNRKYGNKLMRSKDFNAGDCRYLDNAEFMGSQFGQLTVSKRKYGKIDQNIYAWW